MSDEQKYVKVSSVRVCLFEFTNVVIKCNFFVMSFFFFFFFIGMLLCGPVLQCHYWMESVLLFPVFSAPITMGPVSFS